MRLQRFFTACLGAPAAAVCYDLDEVDPPAPQLQAHKQQVDTPDSSLGSPTRLPAARGCVASQSPSSVLPSSANETHATANVKRVLWAQDEQARASLESVALTSSTISRSSSRNSCATSEGSVSEEVVTPAELFDAILAALAPIHVPNPQTFRRPFSDPGMVRGMSVRTEDAAFAAPALRPARSMNGTCQLARLPIMEDPPTPTAAARHITPFTFDTGLLDPVMGFDTAAAQPTGPESGPFAELMPIFIPRTSLAGSSRTPSPLPRVQAPQPAFPQLTPSEPSSPAANLASSAAAGQQPAAAAAEESAPLVTIAGCIQSPPRMRTTPTRRPLLDMAALLQGEEEQPGSPRSTTRHGPFGVLNDQVATPPAPTAASAPGFASLAHPAVFNLHHQPRGLVSMPLFPLGAPAPMAPIMAPLYTFAGAGARDAAAAAAAFGYQSAELALLAPNLAAVAAPRGALERDQGQAEAEAEELWAPGTPDTAHSGPRSWGSGVF